MAPASALHTTDTEKPQKKTVSSGSMTTGEKQSATESKNANDKAKPNAPPAKAKALKRVSLPPPREWSQSQKDKPAAKKRTQPVKSMTTKEKVRAAKAKAAKKAKNDVKSAEKAKDGTKGGTKLKKTNPLSLYSHILSQDASSYQYIPKKAVTSVLLRPTQKTTIFKEKLRKALEQSGATAVKDASPEGEGRAFRIMALPVEVRSRIWKLCVVDPHHFVWPDNDLGHEQPDLAMVSRQVREEVLPIYYGLNTFGVDLLTREVQNIAGKKKHVRGVAAIAKWSAILEEKKWFAFVRKWAFDYAPLLATGLLKEEGEAKSLVVSVMFMMTKGAIWDARAPEVHRDARCVLPGHPNFGKCEIEDSPAWLNDLVTEAIEKAKTGGMRGDVIVELADRIKARGDELENLRCRKLIKAMESGSAVECE